MLTRFGPTTSARICENCRRPWRAVNTAHCPFCRDCCPSSAGLTFENGTWHAWVNDLRFQGTRAACLAWLRANRMAWFADRVAGDG